MDHQAYSGHALRVYNYARQILGPGRWDDELATASAFHDIGIWTDHTFDYLEPSVSRARDFIRDRAPGLAEPLVAEVIANHHRLDRIRGDGEAELVEAFRRADLVDVTGGLYGAGLDPAFRSEVVAAFPYAGFHGVLLRAALPWVVRHPLRPLPVVRIGHPRGARAPHAG